ncbi:hypothetical protein DXV76_17530 [Rhodobacteraceae bacterium CCMM004]|nr:hypothetical protein DXV76_17530 [Rhodobacteraceae bacterium CCMM004]
MIRLALRLLRIAALCLAALPAAAQSLDTVAALDILPGWRDEGGHVAALRIQLAPGWKTYWRAPGDAGIPPTFDWRGSENLKSVEVHWPTPEVFHQNGMTSVGYRDGVILPFRLVPRDPSRPIRLRAKVDMGVCEDVCIPLTREIVADLPAGGGRPDARIRAALADRPLSAAEAGVASVRCEVAPLRDGVALTAEVAVPPMGGGEFAVFELPDRRVWVSEADMERRGGTLTARVELIPPRGAAFALDRSAVRLTLLGRRGAVDIRGCG